MVRVVVGDILKSDAQTLVNTVNCVGVMGKGIALEFKRKFPDMFSDYLDRCQKGEVRLGRPYLFKRAMPPWILNFPTKDHWRSLAKVDDIIEGLEYLLEHYREWGITSISVPPLGAGQGQLEWRIVGPILHQLLSKMDVPVELFAPHGTPTDELEQSFLVSSEHPGQLLLKSPPSEWVRPSWVALVEVLRRVESQRHHWPVGRISFQKMAYIASEEGLPLGLEFRRGSYGPFSPDLKLMQSRLENNGLIREYRTGKMFEVRVGPTFENASRSYARDLARWEGIIRRVSDLFMRVNTKRAEVIATVVLAERSLRKQLGRRPTEMEIVDTVGEWKVRRKPGLDAAEVASAVRNLAALGWLQVTSSDDLPIPEHARLDV